MSKILVNTIVAAGAGGTFTHYAGDVLADAVVAAAVEKAGGIVVDSATYPDMVTLSVAALAARRRGNIKQAESLMMAGFTALAGDVSNLGTAIAALLPSVLAGQGASGIGLQDAGSFFATDNVEAALQALAGGTAGNGAGFLKKTVTITQAADLAGLGGGVKTFDKNVGTALPAGARILSVTAETVTDFDDAAHGTYVVTVGTSAGGNQVGTSLNVAAGQTGFPKQFTAGAQGYVGALQSTAQLSARLTSSVDLNTATVGAITVIAFYFVLP